jgi:S1-C subfamily serine protease
MRGNRHFVRSTDISERTPTRIDGAPSVNAYDQLIGRLEKRAGRDAATLFAEPVFPTNVAGISARISWYSVYEGSVVEIASIDEVARRPVVEKLAARLAAFEIALHDPEIGPAIATWLNIIDPRDIISVGGEPVLVGWGFLPANISQDRQARAEHFAQTLGRFAPTLQLPPVEAMLPGKNFNETPGEAPQHTDKEVTRAMSSAPIPPASETGPGSPPPPPPIGNGGPPSPPPGGPRPTAGRRAPWRAPLIACVIAASVLIILLLPGVLRFPARDSALSEALELQRLHASNESLETQLKALQGVASDRTCRAGDPLIQVPDTKADAPPLKMELLPRSPQQVSIPGAADGTTVAGLLENATVLVFAIKSADSGEQGTGFFINDHTIVTNRHVIEKAIENKIFVASRALGGIRRARLVTRSASNSGESDFNVDFAVLEVEAGTSRAFLPIGPTPAKLSTVYVAGFPAFITQADVNFDNFLRKLVENLKEGDADATLKRDQVEVPSPDLRYGRVNNVIHSGSQALPVVLHDMQLAPGHSGGPLLDACGRVGGVNTWDLRNSEGPQQANVAQDASVLANFLKERNIEFKSDDSPCANTPAVAQTVPPPPAPK